MAEFFKGAHSVLKHLPQQQLRRLTVSLPPAIEQRRIVSALEKCLEGLDGGLAQLAAARQRLSALRSREADMLLDGIASMRPLGELLREPLRNGYSGRSSELAGSTRTITLTAVTKNDFCDMNAKMADTGGRRIDDLWLESGDILVQRSNTPELVGTSALYRGASSWAIFPDLLIRVRVDDNLLPEFAHLVLSSKRVRSELRKSAKGLAGTMPKIDQGSLMRLGIPVPDLARQKRVVVHAANAEADIGRLERSLHGVQRRGVTLRQSLLSAAFAGHLVPQDPTDEPASVLLERIRAEQVSAPKLKRAPRGPRPDPAQETLS